MAGCVGAAVVVVAGAAAAVLFGAPRLENRPPPDGAAAGVEEGVAEVVAPPSEKRGFCGVAVDVAEVVEGWEVVAPPREGKRGFEASVPAEGNLKAEPCVLGVAPVVAAMGFPKRGFAPVSEVVAAGVVDSGCLSLFKFPNNPPVEVEVDGVAPNSGLDVAPCPKRPPLVCACEVPPVSDGVVVAGAVVVVVVVEGVLVAAVFRPPPNKGFCVVCVPNKLGP